MNRPVCCSEIANQRTYGLNLSHFRHLRAFLLAFCLTKNASSSFAPSFLSVRPFLKQSQQLLDHFHLSQQLLHHLFIIILICFLHAVRFGGISTAALSSSFLSRWMEMMNIINNNFDDYCNNTAYSVPFIISIHRECSSSTSTYLGSMASPWPQLHGRGGHLIKILSLTFPFSRDNIFTVRSKPLQSRQC